jgi:tetratricopeptide (TPR) repeat protein
VSAKNNLASTFGELGQLNEAATMQREVLEKRRRILSDEHPSTIWAMSNLASTLGELGQLDDSIAMSKEAYIKLTALFGPCHPYSKVICRNLTRCWLTGLIEMFCETSPESEKVLVQQTVRDFTQTFGSQHPSTFLLTKTIANLYIGQEKLEEAEKMYEEALQGVGDTFIVDDELRGDVVARLGRLYMHHGRLTKAEDMLTRELHSFGEAPYKDHASAMNVYYWLVRSLLLPLYGFPTRAGCTAVR